MQLSSSIPTPGFGGVVPSSPASPCDVAASGPVPASAPAEFALLFAGLTIGLPEKGASAAPLGAGWLGGGNGVTSGPTAGETPEGGGDASDVSEVATESGTEPDLASETEIAPESGVEIVPAAVTSCAAAVIPTLPVLPMPSPASGAEVDGDNAVESDPAAATPASATEDRAAVAGGRKPKLPATPLPAWSDSRPAGVSRSWVQSPSAVQPDPAAATDGRPTEPSQAAPVAIPATPASPASFAARSATADTPSVAIPATPATPAVPAAPGEVVARETPAAGAKAPRDFLPLPGRNPIPAGRSESRPGTPVVGGRLTANLQVEGPRVPRPFAPEEVPAADTMAPAEEGSAGIATDVTAVGAAELSTAAPADPAPVASGQSPRRNLETTIPGLALGRTRADTVPATSDGSRAPAPGLARAALESGAESRTAFRQLSNGAAEKPAENFAAPAVETSVVALPAKKAAQRSFLDADEEAFKQDAGALGTGVAKGESAMSLTSFQRRPLSDFVPPPASLTTTTFAGETSRLPGFSETASASRVALRAVNAVTEVKEQMAAGGASVVNMRFSVAGADLAVRVESRAGEVHVTFRSDSVELRAALAEEWQAVSASEAGRPLRAIDPVFTASGNPERAPLSGQSADDGATGYQRDPDSRHSDEPPARSQTTHTFTAGRLARAPQVAAPRAALFSPDHRLQAFA